MAEKDIRIRESVNGVETAPKQPPAVAAQDGAGNAPESAGNAGAGTAAPAQEAQAAPAATEATAGGETYTARPAPEPGARNRAALGEYKPLYSDEELAKARKRGRRESRMATAGHILDTLARVLNYAATTQGAPSARWSNRNVEVDPNKYYSQLKSANEQARKDYWNMALAAGKADNDEYKARVDAWDKGEKNSREAALQPYRIEGERLKNAGQERANKKQELENKWLPEKTEAEIGLTKAKTGAANAQAYKYTRQGQTAGGKGKKGKTYEFLGEEYGSKEARNRAVLKKAAELGIDTDEYITENSADIVGGKTVSKKTTQKQRKKGYTELQAEVERRVEEEARKSSSGTSSGGASEGGGDSQQSKKREGTAFGG